MISLLILAFNEEMNIEDTISSYLDHFENILVVNDSSKDRTSEIIERLQKNNPKLISINNKKNLGAGKSFQVGIDYFIKSESNYLIKIDGDNQFTKKDVLKIKKIAETEEFDFVKSDRFWRDGIVGNIPSIRYIGNIFASLLIKFSTGFLSINDPLNGLIMVSKKAAKNIDVPKIFYRYGYPFYVIVAITGVSLKQNLKIGQIKNTVVYGSEKSKLSPIIMLIKLIYYTFRSYIKKVKQKINYSQLQSSFAIDILSLIFLASTIFQLIRFVGIRYFGIIGSQSAWFIVFTIFGFLTVLLFRTSLKVENKIFSEYFKEIS